MAIGKVLVRATNGWADFVLSRYSQSGEDNSDHIRSRRYNYKIPKRQRWHHIYISRPPTAAWEKTQQQESRKLTGQFLIILLADWILSNPPIPLQIRNKWETSSTLRNPDIDGSNSNLVFLELTVENLAQWRYLEFLIPKWGKSENFDEKWSFLPNVGSCTDVETAYCMFSKVSPVHWTIKKRPYNIR